MRGTTFLDHRRQVSRNLWLLRPSPVIAHWVSYQQKPSSELGTSLSSNKGQNGHEMPPKVWSNLWPQGGLVNYKLTLTKSIASDWTTKSSAICLYGDWTPCCYSCSTVPEGVQGVGKIPWRRKWQPTPVLLPGKSHGQRSLLGYSPWGHKESDTTEWLH